MPANRTATGQFAKGHSGNPKGRPALPPGLKNYAQQSPEKLKEIAENVDTPVKVRADIWKWFAEMYYGKSAQQVSLDGDLNTSVKTTVVKFEGELEEWAQ